MTAPRKSGLAAGLGPGQWTEPPTPKVKKTLTQRLVDGIGKGDRLGKLAAETDGQDLRP